MHFASASLWPLILALFSFQLQRSCGCSTKDLFRSNWLHALPPTVRTAVLPPAFGIRQSSRRANRLVPVPVRAAAATTTDGITEQRYINIYFDSTNDCHRDRTCHPESPARIDACVNKLRNEMDNTDGSGIGGSLRLFDVADFPKSADGGTAAHGHRPFSSCELGATAFGLDVFTTTRTRCVRFCFYEFIYCLSMDGQHIYLLSIDRWVVDLFTICR